MLYMGIDVGSSGCKVSVVDETGKLMCFTDRRYSFIYENETSELNPNLVLEKTMSAIKEIATKMNLSDLATISVTSFGEMFVLLDENRNVLSNSISYNDRRGKEEAEIISREFGNDKIYSITGATVNAMYSLPKLMWIKKHQPEIYKKANKVCLFADFILIKLGAEFHMDYSLAARTLMFDVKDKCWSKSILGYAGIEEEKLSKPVSSGTVVGEISNRIARELGLPKGVLLLAGGHDQSCAALGAGIIKDGMALDGMGSNECIVPCFENAMINDTMKHSNLACVPFVIPDKYVTYAFNRTCGTVLDWYRGLLGNISYDELFGEMDDKPTKQLFLPHFAGAATPYMDDDATGAMVGLDLTVTRKQITKSIIEGFNYEIRTNLQCLNKAGFEVRELYASGGMSQNDKVLQIKADVLGLPIHRLEHSQTGTMAMAILGSVATKVYRDIPSAVAGLVRSTRTFEPNAIQHKVYQELFEKYKNIYPAVRTIQGRKKSMKRKIRFGIIGCGLMGREFASAVGRWSHLTEDVAIPEIVGVCSRTTKSMEWFQKNFDTIKYATTDYRELLNKDDIDVIYCAIPHNLHKDVYCDIIKAGKHLLGEKPFGIDKEDNEEIMKVIEAHPEVIVRCASEFPFYPACQELVKWINEDRFGRILEVRVGFNHSSDMDLNKPINWKRTIEINGEYGCMGDLGIHTQHVPFRVGWKPQDVYAVLSNIATERPDGKGNIVPCKTWDNATLICNTVDKNNNLFPMFMETKRMSPGSTNEWYIEVYGLECSAKFSTNDPNAFFYTQAVGKEQAWCRLNIGYKPQFKTITGGIFEFGFTDAILQMWCSFVKELCGEEVAFGCFTPEETRLSHQVLTAAIISQKEKRVVELE